MTKPTTAHASLPPGGLSGLEPSWSRLVDVPVTDGVGRTWHVLDNQVANPQLTVLCVHGNPSWSYLYRNLVRSAPDGVRVIAVDQLEMGFSERSGRVRRLAQRVDDLCELTEAMQITGPVVTVAHDWGGPISLGWAQRHLEQLVGVVLMNTAVHQPAGSPAPSLIRLTRSRPMLQNVTVRTTSFIRGALEMSDQRPPADVRRGFLAPYLTSARRAAIAEFVADIPLDPDHPSAATLDRIAADLELLRDVPTLLLWGAKDKVFSDLYLHDLERRLPNADVHRYPNAGHFVSEDVDAVGAIVDWLGTLDRAVAAGPADDRASTLLDTHAELGAKLAVAEMTGGTRSITYAEFAELVESTAAGLAGGGVGVGDRVALMVPPGVDLTVTLYACWRAGAVIVLIDSGLGPSGMNAAIRAADPAHLIGIPKALAAARTLHWPGRRIAVEPLSPARQRVLGVATDLPAMRARPGVLPDPPTPADLAAVVFTSGSTGPSKGVTYTHGQLEAQRDALADLYGITSDDRLVAAFAPFALFGPALGVSSIVPDMDVTAPGTLSAAALGDAVREVGATMVFASPAALANLVRTADGLTEWHRAAFEQVRVLLSAGAPVRASLLRSAADLFPNATAHTPYGMTECLPVASISLTQIEAGSGGDGVCVGRPLNGVDVRIRPLDGLGRATGPLTGPLTGQHDVLGEVVVRAAHARSGYDRLWHTEFAASQPPGWHSTGDLGHLDEQARLWIGGRLSDVIATADGPVAPVRIEHAIETIDGVDTAAVVGVGPPGAQQIVAVVQPVESPGSPRLADLRLIDAVRGVTDGLLTPFCQVCAVFEVPELPVDRRHNSKIDRARVADWAARALAGGRVRRL
ncbi:MAG TPA: alpha/beta fold hydrolase [Ilumatobacter sp.]|nr:alpha/beta fold hydrolase [Ilumatobacter sp.]